MQAHRTGDDDIDHTLTQQHRSVNERSNMNSVCKSGNLDECRTAAASRYKNQIDKRIHTSIRNGLVSNSIFVF